MIVAHIATPMGFIQRVFGVFGFSSRDDSDSPYRCIQCGASLDREYRTCPDCGGMFVAPTDEQIAGNDKK